MVIDISAAAQRIELVLTDCDGVLTDGGVYVSESGEAMKRFSLRDGMGVARLRSVGVDVGIVTGEVSEPLRRRAEKLRITELHEGVSDKLAVLDAVCAARGISYENVAYIGDDVNDLATLEVVGLAGAPADAMAEVQKLVHVVVPANGGHGAFRSFAEIIVSANQRKTLHA